MEFKLDAYQIARWRKILSSPPNIGRERKKKERF